ncbi:uncharacterized protein LOC103372948 [Stegastes partitus]|uniref:Uncharacterized protein LOC103372948 n=1 Tax=Stegastes partitus TaxID=144197 RepID=A0A9Y4NPN8_9TELE|nr:PREDICTED: uncharacterized protein LOC103372948 [Stegastes partitus]
MIVSFQSGSSEDVLTPFKDVLMALEGDTVTLSCNYSGSVDYLFWYQQKSSSSPQFLIQEHSEKIERLSFNHDKQSKKFHLQISSAAVTDSAVYYCALRPAGANKMIFGSGTRLTIEPRAEYEPSYFKLQHDGTTACLATGFSRHNAALGHRNYSNLFNDSEAVRISPDLALYNQVIFLDDGEDACEESSGEDVPCVDTMSPDKTVSMASVAVLGLRVILFKTIVFNVLLTMRLWISQ